MSILGHSHRSAH